MIVLLSPAKDLAKDTPAVRGTTQPQLLEHALPIAEKLRAFSAKELAELMGISPALGELNRVRYQQWSPPFTPKNARPAIFTFNGEVYRGLDARSLTEQDLRFAQRHLRILSGLYGVLRPLDLMQDYRLMMGTPLAVGRAKDLYAHWRGPLTETLRKDLRASGSKVVIDLASGEYARAVDFERLGARVIKPEFKERVGGRYKPVQVYVKHQRGAMARFIVRHRVLDPERLKAYDEHGYRFAPEESTTDVWVFLRDERPPLVPRKLPGGRVRG